MSTKTAYAVVYCSDMNTPSAKMLSNHGISNVTTQPAAMWQITFEDNFFEAIPAVQVTAMYNGWQGSSEAPIDSPSIPPGYNPANQMVHACILWTTQKACQIRTDTAGGWAPLSFSITATGSGT